MLQRYGAAYTMGVLASIKRIPLRTRLILAFLLLIISSASATILIGNTVFGDKVDEVARDLATVQVGLAWQVFQARLEKMQLLARGIAAGFGQPGDRPALRRLAESEVPLDFVLFGDPPDDPVLLQFRERKDSSSESEPPAVSSGKALAIIRGALFPFWEKAAEGRTSVTGLAAADASDIAPLAAGYANDRLLLLIAAAPLEKSKSGAVLLGYILNGRADLLAQAQLVVPSRHKEGLRILLYAGDRHISSSTGSGETTGARADPKVIETVLRRGSAFTGVAAFHGSRCYSAFMPLRDLTGKVIGMLGIGNSIDLAEEVRRRTIALFSSLIAAGMIFGLIMTFLFSAWLVTPVSQLAEGMSRVAEGDLNYKVRIESADELGKLARAFNRMVRAVKERDHKLREMTESRLTQVEKQVSVGRLAAGVAHEINNPLTAILSLSSLWLKRMPAEDKRREDLEIIVAETSRCREIVRSLLDFARERPIEKREVDLNVVARETLLLAHKYDSMTNRKVELKAAPFPLMVNADPKLLQQVLINLLLNAVEASDWGGVVNVETDEDSSGGFVQVRIIDSGKGIPKAHINRVFEPFFTTKGAGKGTGLGLSVSLGIIQKHEGTIEIESEEGRGTTVTVLLPRVGEARP